MLYNLCWKEKSLGKEPAYQTQLFPEVDYWYLVIILGVFEMCTISLKYLLVCITLSIFDSFAFLNMTEIERPRFAK